MKKPIKISPSLLACDFTQLKQEIQKCEEAGADIMHLDVMDGHFVPNLSLGVPICEAVRRCTKLPIHAHLMVSNPDLFIEPFAKAGASWISVHVEACHHLHRTLELIKFHKVRAGIAINPGTSLAALDDIGGDADFVLVMSVNPGFGGQSFIPSTLNKIKKIKQRWPHLDIEVDGGVKAENAAAIIEAGADFLVIGTGLFHSQDYKKTIEKIKKG